MQHFDCTVCIQSMFLVQFQNLKSTVLSIVCVCRHCKQGYKKKLYQGQYTAIRFIQLLYYS